MAGRVVRPMNRNRTRIIILPDNFTASLKIFAEITVAALRIDDSDKAAE